MSQLKPGIRLKSSVCDAEVMVIKAGNSGEVTCGGAPMLAPGGAAGDAQPNAELMNGCQVGKRYVTEDQGTELLCVKAGQGSLAVDGKPLQEKGAKKLPSSD